MKTRNWMLDLNVVLQVALLCGLIFGGLLLGTRLIVQEVFPKYSDIAHYLNGGIALFWLWLVVTGSVRSVHALRKKTSIWMLWLAGGVTALVAVLLASVILSAAADAGLRLGSRLPGRESFLFALGFGLVVSMVSLIHLKVRNRALGNTLELLIVIAILAVLILQAG